MLKLLNKKTLQLSALTVASVTATAGTASATNFSTISGNVTTSIASLFGVLGILKIKDHVENPSQTPLQHGAIRLLAGGGLLALPVIFAAMEGSIGTGGNAAPQDALNALGTGIAGGGAGAGAGAGALT